MRIKNATKNYIPAIDGLRAIAVISVLLTHWGIGITFGGKFGVTLFFFISGFLITNLLIEEFNSTNTINIKDFYLRRIFRLCPALFFMVAVTVFFFFVMRYCAIDWQAILSALLYYRNYYMTSISNDALSGCYSVFDHLWSLAVEEHFYLIFPVIFLFLFKWRRVLLYTLLAFTVVCIMWRYLYVFAWPGHLQKQFIDNLYIRTDARIDSIIYGCIASLIIYYDKAGKFITYAGKPLVLTTSVLILYISYKIQNLFFYTVLQYSVQGICWMIIVPSILYNSRYKGIQKLLGANAFTITGKMSYSLYLMHPIGISIAHYYVAPYRQLNITWLATCIIPGILLSVISYFIIERPFVQIRKRFGSNAALTYSLR